jgi:hypothetical protein
VTQSKSQKNVLSGDERQSHEYICADLSIRSESRAAAIPTGRKTGIRKGETELPEKSAFYETVTDVK